MNKSSKMVCHIIFSVIFSCVAHNAFTEETSQETAPVADEDDSMLHNMLHLFEDMRDTTSKRYVAMSRHIDSYFSGKPYEEGANRSQLRLELKNTLFKAGEIENDIALKARLRLPNTQDKLNLVFSSDPEEEKAIEDRVQSDATGERVKKDESLIGVEYLPDVQESKWEQNLTGGIRLRFPAIFFTRYKIKKNWYLEDQWTSRFEQSFWYFDDKGFGATNEIDFTRPLSEKHTLNIGTDIEYKDADDQYTYSLVVTDTQRLSQTSAMEYAVGSYGQSQPTNQVTGYFIGMTYSKILYKDWLIFTAGPQLSFPRDDDWKATPSFTTELKIYFTE